MGLITYLKVVTEWNKHLSHEILTSNYKADD